MNYFLLSREELLVDCIGCGVRCRTRCGAG
jgi:hypothetical protein